MSSRVAKTVFALLLLSAVVGCGDGRPKRVPVSGQVLIDGKPLTHGYIQFAPGDSRASTGGLDADGHFVLTCFEMGDGAVTGKHKVSVMSQEAIGQETIKWHAPKKYANAKTSGLEQEITGPADDVKIELTWGSEQGQLVEKRKVGDQTERLPTTSSARSPKLLTAVRTWTLGPEALK